MHTLLGANGIIATETAKALNGHTQRIRLVSRNPRKVNPTDETFSADLTDFPQTLAAVKGSEVVYLVPGIPYSTKTWQEQWPVVMKNTIKACKDSGAKLVFFDNVYIYGKVEGWMTEETPFNPNSKKGEVRAKIARMLMDEMKAGSIEALIARSADFYGPNTVTSFFNAMVFDNLSKGKKAQWMVNDKVKHSFTYTPDAGKGTALLGTTPSAFNQVWHLPGDKNVLTGQELVALTAKAFGVDVGHSVLAKWMIAMAGLFNPLIKEAHEMLYQSEFEYLFDTSKFEKAFGNHATTYAQGIAATAATYKK
ncbi:MAG: NAD-dependent epimerase/dehydratase family protein [Bacteroidetes bacterium]|nr:MAG: NAD-dependent epimerase/dehydratase family protein [Bacteroidota bacterium]